MDRRPQRAGELARVARRVPAAVLRAAHDAHELLEGAVRDAARWFANATNATIAMLLAYCAWIFVRSEWEADTQWFGHVPAWLIQWVMPAGFMAIALRSAWSSGSAGVHRIAVLGVMVLLMALFLFAPIPRDLMMMAGAAMLLVSAALGAAVFAVLGGCALLLFWGHDLPIASLAVDHYRLVANPVLPTIPLFTLTGYFLAEGGAPLRLVRVFNALFSNARGGAVAITVVVCAFFTAFTGASGITILTLGALLMPLLLAAGHSPRSGLGLVSTAGSLGVLLPPSLPLILYAVVAKIPIQEFFVRALLPGLLMVGLVYAWARYAAKGVPDDAVGVRHSLGAALWEASGNLPCHSSSWRRCSADRPHWWRPLPSQHSTPWSLKSSSTAA